MWILMALHSCTDVFTSPGWLELRSKMGEIRCWELRNAIPSRNGVICSTLAGATKLKGECGRYHWTVWVVCYGSLSITSQNYEVKILPGRGVTWTWTPHTVKKQNTQRKLWYLCSAFYLSGRRNCLLRHMFVVNKHRHTQTINLLTSPYSKPRIVLQHQSAPQAKPRDIHQRSLRGFTSNPAVRIDSKLPIVSGCLCRSHFMISQSCNQNWTNVSFCDLLFAATADRGRLTHSLMESVLLIFLLN